MICILKFTKEHDSVKLLGVLGYLFSTHRLMMLFLFDRSFGEVSQRVLE